MKNEKGFTIVEIIICFVIVTTIVISMFDLIMNYKNRQQVESINSQMIAYKNSLTKVIQDDVIYQQLHKAECGEKTVTFTFANDTTATLIYEEKGITYNGIHYSTEEIPDFTLAISEINCQTTDNNVFLLKIPFTHPDLVLGMGIYLSIPLS